MRSMPVVFRSLLGTAAACALGSAALAAEPLRLMDGHLSGPVVIDESIHPAIALTIDIARVLRLDRPAGTIVIGNPGIANATLTDDRTLVMTGKAAGTTNMIVLDESGTEISNLLLRVGTAARPHVKVYNGLRRHSYSCAPNCEPVVAIGDENEYFQTILEQTQARQEFSGTAGTGAP
jgi:hypothetical protein